MAERLLPARESLAWLVCFLSVATLIVVTGFTSSDPDSALYAGLADRLSQEPIERWLAPEWWGFWTHVHMSGLFREHPAGVLLLPAALARVGVPAVQGAYVVGVAAGLVSLLLMSGLIRRFTARADGRIALVLLQLMPVAFVFRIRANHEYPMLVCLLVALHGLVAASSRSIWVAALLVSLGLAGGLIIKGVFVVKILLGIALWIAINPTGHAGARRRSAIAAAIGTAAMIAVAVGYERIHYAATLEPFWSMYWQRQLGPLTEVGGLDVILTSSRNLLFYLSRLLWHPAPWSLALVVAGWRMRSSVRPSTWLRPTPAAVAGRETWRAIPADARQGLMFTLAFAVLAILLVSPATRYAERYAFPSSHAIACAGVVAARHLWPAVADVVLRLDRRIPAFPALVWLALALLRLVAGSVLPRIQ
jgi:4-amino-4-deoxy-L-arabinose transferase-like glycosyltransferase